MVTTVEKNLPRTRTQNADFPMSIRSTLAMNTSDSRMEFGVLLQKQPNKNNVILSDDCYDFI